VRWGMRLLAARGSILLAEEDTSAQVSAPDSSPAHSASDEQEDADALRAVLAETAAYRAFFMRISPESLLA